MKPKNTDAYIEAAEEFAQPILIHLRQVVHSISPDIEEAIKWQFPCFLYRGKILCDMAAFKKHVTFGFWLGSLLSDPYKILEKRGENSAMGQLGRITSLNDLPSPEILKEYLIEAMSLIEAGKTLPKKAPSAKKPAEIPDAFREALDKNPPARLHFESMSASHQREYLEYILEAKREETRQRRIQKSIAMLADGKDLNFAYRK